MDYPLSQVSPKAKIGKNVKIGPFVTIADDAEIGDGTTKDCLICTGAVISNIPQDLKFKGEKTTAVIGDRTTIREYVTVNRGTASKNTTIIGDDCLIMAYCHVAHDCKLGNHIITSNACQIAGEVVIDDYATIGGGSLIHQFSHIGTQVMMQGGSRVPKDIPPYAMVGREPLRFIGINSVGLKRRGFTNEQIDAIQRTYRLIYQDGLNFTQAIELAEKEVPECVEKRTIIDFIKSSSRGIINN